MTATDAQGDPRTEIDGVPIVDTFAEAFPMTAARAIVTADTPGWAETAARTMTGYATSVIALNRLVEVRRHEEGGVVRARAGGDVGRTRHPLEVRDPYLYPGLVGVPPLPVGPAYVVILTHGANLLVPNTRCAGSSSTGTTRRGPHLLVRAPRRDDSA